MMQILLPIHILAGTTALLCAALAASSEKGKKLHVLCVTIEWKVIDFGENF